MLSIMQKDVPSDAARDLSVMIEVAQYLGSTFELTTLLHRVQDAALRTLGCDRATLFLYDPPSNELYSEVATGVKALRFSASAGIAGQAVQTRSAILVPDAYADSRFNRKIDEETGYRTRNMLTFPLIGHDGAVVGVLQVLNKKTGDFTAQDERLADALSKLAGVAIERQRLLEQYREKMRMERDLQLASQIQQRCLPAQNPSIEGYSIAGWNRPADETGGDCFDFIPMRDHRLAFLVADATGHGIGPALIIAQCRAMLRTVCCFCDDLKQIAVQVNRLLHDDLPDDRFVTVAFGILDPYKHTITYYSAGHGPLLLLHAATGRADIHNATGMPMAIMAQQEFDVAGPIYLESGDTFAVLTDGFFEWSDPSGELFGTERVLETIRKAKGADSAGTIQRIYEAARKFTKNTPQGDDLTAVIITRL